MSQSSNNTSQNDSDRGARLTENELLAELAALAPPPRRPGGVTVAELTKKVGSPVTARRILFKQEKEGVLYSEMAIEGGHSMRVWYRKE